VSANTLFRNYPPEEFFFLESGQDEIAVIDWQQEQLLRRPPASKTRQQRGLQVLEFLFLATDDLFYTFQTSDFILSGITDQCSV
jgi:hypothetical protein